MMNIQVDKRNRPSQVLFLNAIAMVVFQMASGAAQARANAGTGTTGVCFTDVQSWHSSKPQLPTILQNDFIYTAHNSWDLVGGFAIYPSGNKITVEGRAHQIVAGDIIKSGFVLKACVLGDQLKVGLSTGETEIITLKPTAIIVSGYSFEFTSYQNYLNVINQVQ